MGRDQRRRATRHRAVTATNDAAACRDAGSSIGTRMRSYILAIAAFSFAAVGFLQPCPGRAQTLQERLTPCLTCHGTNGQSQMPEVPSLGGLPSFYVMAQLYMFRERMRPL